MKRSVTIFLAMLLLNPLNALAGHDHKIHSEKSISQSKPLTNIEVRSNEVLIEVHGVVCSFCSKGVQNKLSKLPFVDTLKYLNGSIVEIEKQKITVAIKPGKHADIPAMYKAVRAGGYEPSSAYMLGNNDEIVKFNAKGKNE